MMKTTLEQRIRARMGEHFSRLGVERDSTIARDMGVTPQAVQLWRSALGIPRWRAPVKPAKVKLTPLERATNALGAHVVAMLGKQSDNSLARQHGFLQMTICNWRNRLGIPVTPGCNRRWGGVRVASGGEDVPEVPPCDDCTVK